MMRILLFVVFLTFLFTHDSFSQPNFYGYFATKFEKTFDEPAVDGNGNTIYESGLYEWDYGSFNLMMQERIGKNIKVFFNLNGAGAEELILQNYWGEYTVNRYLNIRAGKIYRKFGLYNEVLDAVPTYYGIEPPELFDGDHLMLSRFTTFMIHGSSNLGRNGVLNYSFSSENGDGGAGEGKLPIGFDLNYNYGSLLKLGTSGYFSGEGATASNGMGERASQNGVLPWMASDDYSVLGAYLELNIDNLMVQGAFWTADHNAIRDADNVVSLIENANPNQSQLNRFLIDPNGDVDAANINTDGAYSIETWFVRLGYSIETGLGEIAPYFQWDYFSNPETVASKAWGGDNEAGVADDGIFHKQTAGIIYRPTYQLAFKLDQSYHIYQFNGESESYPEMRLNISYTFGL